MDRRDFLKAALLTGAAQTGCASVQERPAVEPLPDMEATLGKLDRDLARIDGQQVHRHFAALVPPERLLQELTPREPLLRGGVRALYLSGAFRDLSEEEQLHPGVQARLWRTAPHIDEAVLGMQRTLATISDAELLAVRNAMREDPLLLPRVVECLDAASVEGEIQPERRLKMRSLMKTLGWRMQHQSPRAVIGEYVDKLQRMGTRDGALAEQERRLAARMSEAAFFEYRERVERIALRWQEQRAGAGGDEWDFERAGMTYVGPGSGGLSVGLSMMGYGVIAVGVGLVMLIPVPLRAVGVVVTTLGGISIIVGLLVTIISGIVRAVNSEEAVNWKFEEGAEKKEVTPAPPVHRPMDPSNLWRPH